MCTSGPLDRAEYIALWIHFEERAAGVREQMIATLTWLHGILVTLIGLVYIWHHEPLGEKLSEHTLLVTSWVGLVLSLLSLLVTLDFVCHKSRNYNRSKCVRDSCTSLGTELTRLGVGDLQKRKRGGERGTEPRSRFVIVEWLKHLSKVECLKHVSKLEMLFTLLPIVESLAFSISLYWLFEIPPLSSGGVS